MKRIFIKKYYKLSLCILATLPGFAQAQQRPVAVTPAIILQAINDTNANITNAINQLLNGYGKNNYSQYSQQAPNIEQTSNINSATGILRDTANNEAKLLTQTVLVNALVPASYVQRLLTMCVPGPDYPLPADKNPCATQTYISRGLYVQSSKNEAFSASTLMDPYGYGKTESGHDEAQMAERFIAFVSNYASQIKNPYLGKSPEELAKMIQQSDTQAELLSLRSQAAALSTGLSALYHFYTERIMVNNLAKDKGVAENDPLLNTFFPQYPNASLLELERYQALRRTSNPQWYTQMGQASSTALARENLYVNAEVLAELFKLRMSTEQLNATMAALLMQQTQMAKQIPKGMSKEEKEQLQQVTE